jgi:hypothetical protein
MIFWITCSTGTELLFRIKIAAQTASTEFYRKSGRRKTMDLLYTIGIVLLVLWVLGLVTSYTIGGFIHILLVLAIIVILIRVIQGRRPIP